MVMEDKKMKLQKCVDCQMDVSYKVIEADFEYEDEEVSLKYRGKKAICEKCGKELIIDEIENFNQFRFEEEYKKINEIITNEEINEILKKYSIGKRPLSSLLGFGEVTITRYLSGYIPTKKNSALLKKILYNPETYYSILMSNKKNITALAYNKTMKAVLKFIDNSCFEDDNISEVTNYIISKIDITPKALQKILYYIQIFSFIFLGYPPFASSCKKWGHGPVFGKIYYQYKEFGYKVIETKSLSGFNIDKDLLEVSNAIIKYFGCYSADVLENFTHNERPWKDTLDNEIIEKELMKEYAFEIHKKYQINELSDIEKYSNEMFKNYLMSR